MRSFACGAVGVRGSVRVDQVALVLSPASGRPVRLVTQDRKLFDRLQPTVRLATRLVAVRLHQQLRRDGKVGVPFGLEVAGRTFRFKGKLATDLERLGTGTAAGDPHRGGGPGAPR